MNIGIGRAVSTPDRALTAATNRLASQHAINTRANSNNSTKGIMGFQNILSRTEPAMTDDEFKEAVRLQAQKDAASGVFQGSELLNLRTQFVAVSSPDRRTIIASKLSSLATMLHGRFGGINSMFVEHPSGLAAAGFRIAQFSPQHGWEPLLTGEEVARQQEILRIYNEAWDAARFGAGEDRTSTFGAVEVQNSVDYTR